MKDIVPEIHTVLLRSILYVVMKEFIQTGIFTYDIILDGENPTEIEKGIYEIHRMFAFYRIPCDIV